MGLELAKAYVSVGADTTKLEGDFHKVQTQVTSRVSGLSRLVGPAIAAVAGGAGLASMISVGNEAIQLAQRQQAAEARLAAILKVTGGAAGFSAQQLKQYAAELQNSTTTADESILESMAILGTFKSVSGDVFKRATVAALDLSATGFGNVSSATNQLAKALEDPIAGLGNLREVGVTFTEEQTKQIKNFVEMNDKAAAQAVILDAVEGQVSGAAEALAKTDAGKYEQLNNKLDAVKETLGSAILPLFIKFKELQVLVAERIVEVVKWIRVLAENSGVTWDLLQVQAKLSVSQIWDIMTNLWENLPTLAMASVKTMSTAFSGWVEYIGLALKNMLGLFQTVFQAIEDFWTNIFSGEGFGASFDKAMSQIGNKMRDNAKSQFEKLREVGTDVANTWSEETKDVDLMAMSERSKMLENDRNKLVQQLVDARAAMDVTAAEAVTAAAATEMAKPTENVAAAQDPAIEAGRTGFAELGKKIQDAMFGEQDKNQKAMINLMEAGNRIQEQQLAAMKNPAPVKVEGGFLE